ncbi:hypothetical protein CALVIDRAFT_403841 [Calocera viscosa TUFC12733]|uniref:Uncharacterized protein n=1 Tax=Calocera viscosa (strain TUFC12733) TaxID=1330018 RepID=A0A167PV02_CALVF|nr:hypothetical protein CALVIDRAFT_403841 [Calocera viscosa TUFC12733]
MLLPAAALRTGNTATQRRPRPSIPIRHSLTPEWEWKALRGMRSSGIRGGWQALARAQTSACTGTSNLQIYKMERQRKACTECMSHFGQIMSRRVLASHQRVWTSVALVLCEMSDKAALVQFRTYIACAAVPYICRGGLGTGRNSLAAFLRPCSLVCRISNTKQGWSTKILFLLLTTASVRPQVSHHLIVASA